MGGGKSTGSSMECRVQDMFCWERGASSSVWWPTRKTYTLLEEKHCHLDSYLLGSSCVELHLCNFVVLSLSFSVGVARGNVVSTTRSSCKTKTGRKIAGLAFGEAPFFFLFSVFSLISLSDVASGWSFVYGLFLERGCFMITSS